MFQSLLAVSFVDEIFSSTQLLVFLAIVISGLIALSGALLFGHDGAEIGHDHEIGHGGADGHDGAPSLLSLRGLFAFMLGFGSIGAIATALGSSPILASMWGIVGGLAMALLAWGAALLFFNQQADSSIQPGQVIGQKGTVVTDISAEGIGDVNISVRGQIVNYTARSKNKNSIKSGTRVIVREELGGTVLVEEQAV